MGYEGEAHWRLGGWGVAWGGVWRVSLPETRLFAPTSAILYSMRGNSAKQIERNICSKLYAVGFVHMVCTQL